ncbi:MAG: hypothetical protein ACRDRJ_27795 [Streptosporangiaceae bacterium]
MLPGQCRRGGDGAACDVGEGGHAQLDRRAAGGELVELGEFLPGGGEADFQALGLAEPAFALGFLDAGGQVVAQGSQPGPLGWVRAQQRTSDALLTELTTVFQQFMAGFRLLALTCPRDRIG